MSLLDLRERVRATLAEQITSFAEVRVHAGRFDLDETKRWAVKTPCASVAVLGVRSGEIEGTQVTVNVALGAFVFTSGIKGRVGHDDLALGLTSDVLRVVVSGQTWGDPSASASREVRAENLFSGKVDQQGVSLWAVLWLQPYDIDLADEATLDDFLRYRADWNLAPADAFVDAQDAVDLPAPEDP